MAKILTPKTAALAIKKKFDPLGGNEIVVKADACNDKAVTPYTLGKLIVKCADITGLTHTVKANASASSAKACTTAGLNAVLDKAKALIQVAPKGVFQLHIAGDAGTFLLPIKKGAINDLHIDWGDGTHQNLTATLTDDNGVSHTYASRAEPYTISLSGTTYNTGTYNSTNCGALGFGLTSSVSGSGALINKDKIVGAGGAPFLLLPERTLTGISHSLQYFGQSMFHQCQNLILDPDFDLVSGIDRLGTIGYGHNFLFGIFSTCTSLTTTPTLPSLPKGVTGASSYLAFAFANCKKLTNAPTIPDLPSGAQNNNDYLSGTFSGCISLTTAPPIPPLPSGTTLASAYLKNTFCNCASLTITPTIPALLSGVTNASYYLNSTFQGCAGLTYAPTIPVLPSGVTNAEGYLQGTFYECRSLTSAPTIPALPSKATNADKYLYETFYVCTSLTSAPTIPTLPSGVTNASNYLKGTFCGCTGLASAPKIPALPSGVKGVHYYLNSTFSGCTKLLSITALPAFPPEGVGCFGTYEGTFGGCSSLAISINTILPDTAVPSSGTYDLRSFASMFSGCSKLTGSGRTAIINRVTMKPWSAPTAQPSNKCFYNCTSLSDYASIPALWKAIR